MNICLLFLSFFNLTPSPSYTLLDSKCEEPERKFWVEKEVDWHAVKVTRIRIKQIYGMCAMYV